MKKKKMRIFIFQPYLTHYRTAIFNKLNKYFYIKLAFNSSNKESHIKANLNKDIKIIYTKKKKFFGVVYQKNLIKKIQIRNINSIILASDIKSLTQLKLILYSKISDYKIFLWGHGLFKKKINIFNFILYKFYFYLISFFITKYICYNKICFDSLIGFLPKKKMVILNNTLEKKIDPSSIKKNYKISKDLLFVGRLRDKCGLMLLLKALSELKNFYIKLHVIGDGKNLVNYKNYSKKLNVNVTFYKKRIFFSKIASKCFAGVYPGDTGLSVVDYMMHGLPVIIHNKINDHMGPEAAYIINRYNGLNFKKNSSNDLKSKIMKLYKNRTLVAKLGNNSIKTIKKLNKESMHISLKKIIERS